MSDAKAARARIAGMAHDWEMLAYDAHARGIKMTRRAAKLEQYSTTLSDEQVLRLWSLLEQEGLDDVGASDSPALDAANGKRN